jgi:hypothetical protein
MRRNWRTVRSGQHRENHDRSGGRPFFLTGFSNQSSVIERWRFAHLWVCQQRQGGERVTIIKPASLLIKPASLIIIKPASL